MIRRTSCEVLLCASVYYAAGITAFDGWICRVDVIRVGADLRVRPQNRLRSGEDGRTHRSAPTVGASTPTSGPPKRSRPSFRNEKKLRFSLAYKLRKQRVTRIIVTRQIAPIALIKRTSQEVRRIVAVGRRGYSPERPMDRRMW